MLPPVVVMIIIIKYNRHTDNVDVFGSKKLNDFTSSVDQTRDDQIS